MSWKRSAERLGLVASLALSTTVARADDDLPSLPAPAVEAGGTSTPKDLVRLKNGGIIRGTIIELEPLHHVTIQLATGQTRTIRWTEATYVGAEADVPSTGEPARAATETPVRVEKQLRSTGALVGGIVAVVVSQISAGVAMIGWMDELHCEGLRRQDAHRAAGAYPYGSTGAITRDCNNSGTIAAGVVGSIVLLAVGVPLIVYGAKRVPVEKAALRFVPWSQGTTAAGGSVQLRF